MQALKKFVLIPTELKFNKKKLIKIKISLKFFIYNLADNILTFAQIFGGAADLQFLWASRH